jgi:hypothetical protein
MWHRAIGTNLEKAVRSLALGARKIVFNFIPYRLLDRKLDFGESYVLS